MKIFDTGINYINGLAFGIALYHYILKPNFFISILNKIEGVSE
jgi:hypothetical protein